MTKTCSVIKRVKDSYTKREYWSVVGELWDAPNGVYITRYRHGWVPVYNAFAGWAASVESAIEHFFSGAKL